MKNPTSREYAANRDYFSRQEFFLKCNACGNLQEFIDLIKNLDQVRFMMSHCHPYAMLGNIIEDTRDGLRHAECKIAAFFWMLTQTDSKLTKTAVKQILANSFQRRESVVWKFILQMVKEFMRFAGKKYASIDEKFKVSHSHMV